MRDVWCMCVARMLHACFMYFPCALCVCCMFFYGMHFAMCFVCMLHVSCMYPASAHSVCCMPARMLLRLCCMLHAVYTLYTHCIHTACTLHACTLHTHCIHTACTLHACTLHACTQHARSKYACSIPTHASYMHASHAALWGLQNLVLLFIRRESRHQCRDVCRRNPNDSQSL